MAHAHVQVSASSRIASKGMPSRRRRRKARWGARMTAPADTQNQPYKGGLTGPTKAGCEGYIGGLRGLQRRRGEPGPASGSSRPAGPRQ
eukprot:2575710-Rhodomonas_salina.1